MSYIKRRRFIQHAGAAVAAAGLLGVLRSACAQRTHRTFAEIDASAVRRLVSALRDRVILPGDSSYESKRRVWNLAADRRPGAIVRCGSLRDVLLALEFARNQELEIAVRSGGHSLAGHSVCDGGLVIDLGEMKGVHVDPSARVARALPGTRARELLQATQAHGISAPTGGCPDVGIAGLTLGGGENLLMARYGAVCDSVLAAQVVTADGRTLRASGDENQDLYWAIRGGSGNFGIVTSIEYRLNAVTELIVGTFFLPVARARETLQRYRDLMQSAPDDLETSAGYASGERASTVLVIFAFCGDPTQGERLADRWRSELRPVSDDVKRTPYGAYFTMPSAATTGTGCFVPELGDEAIAALTSHFESAPPFSSAICNDYHGEVTRISKDAMAFPLRRRGFSFYIASAWRTNDERSAATQWTRSLSRELQPHSQGVYVNDLFDEGSARAREAYGANYSRLAHIKAKYDPENVFHLNQNISPYG